MSAKLRALLDSARRRPEGERSLSQEIELRLWGSFTAEKDIEKRFGGVGTADVLGRLANSIKAIEVNAGGARHWLDDPFVYEHVRTMINIVLDQLKPRGRRVVPKPLRRWHPSLRQDIENIGRRHALELLAQLKAGLKEQNTPKEWPPVELLQASGSLGRRVRGTPIVNFLDYEEKIERRRDRYRKKRDASLEPHRGMLAEQGKVDPFSARGNTIYAIVSYLRPRLIKGAALSMADVLNGITGRDLAENKPIILERIKAATEGKLIGDASTLDGDFTKIINAASAWERLSRHRFSNKQHRELQRQAEELLATIPKGGSR